MFDLTEFFEHFPEESTHLRKTTKEMKVFRCVRKNNTVEFSCKYQHDVYNNCSGFMKIY